MELFDSHAHFNDDKFEEGRQEMIQNAYHFGVSKIVNIGCDVKSSNESILLAKEYPFIYAACGISPNDMTETKKQMDLEISKIEAMMQGQSKVVAIGEIGLDFYWEKENADLQRYAFQQQILLANQYSLPIVIHTREAVMDTLKLLKENTSKLPGIFHCCPLNRELIKEALKLGFYISFAGPITFKNSKNAEEMVTMVPEDRLLIETDSPYLSPEPRRGQRNDSRNVRYIAEKMAEFRKEPLEKIANSTYENAKRVFQIKD